MERYIVQEGSESAHCCFTATVIDTSIGRPEWDKEERYWDNGANICECFELEHAQLIAKLLNAHEATIIHENTKVPTH